MVVRPSDLHSIPLFENITDEHLTELMEAFEHLELPSGEVLFEARTAPKHFLLLVRGEVALKDGAETRFRLAPITPIGELGAVTGLPRTTTAVTTQASEVWRIGTSELRQFFEDHGDVAFPFYSNLLTVVTAKVRRDMRRLEDVRTNLIRTQKAMKGLRDMVLESEETPLSKSICATLEDMIEKNRRWHYMVEPAHTLSSSVRLDSGQVLPVAEISDGWLRLRSLPDAAKGEAWSAVLVLPTTEFPLSGTVDSVDDDEGVLVKLDLLIDEYSAALQDYLTRLHMLDFVV